MDINEIDNLEDYMEDNDEVSSLMQLPEDLDNEQETEEYQEDESSFEGSALEEFLRGKGVDPRSVKFETEDGEETSDFNDLTNEDLLSILNSLSEDESDLDDLEIGLLNFMRTNNWSVQDYNLYIARLAIELYTASLQPQEQTYKIDDLSDEELFLVDLKSRIPDITEDEALEELDRSQLNEDLFNKKVQSLRTDYKQKEDLYNQQQQEEIQRLQQLQQEQYLRSIYDAINRASVIDLGDLDLELQDEDKRDVYNFLTGYDKKGNRLINNTLADPDQLVRMAWMNIKGPEMFAQLSSYYKQKISEVAKNNYNRGYEDAKGGRSYNQAKAKSVVRKRKALPKNGEISINDIDDFLD